MEYEIVKLEDVCTIGKVSDGDASRIFDPTIGRQEMLSCFYYNCECILVSDGRGIPFVSYVNGEFRATSDTYIITCDDTRVHIKYLYYSMGSTIKSFLSNKRRPKSPAYSAQLFLQNYRCMLPPIEAQLALIDVMEHHDNPMLCLSY